MFYTFVHCSSCSHTWDAFQVADASFRLYCIQNNNFMPSNNSQEVSSKPGPQLLGDPPKIDITLPEVDVQEEENSPENLPSIKIYDDDVIMRFLVCGVPRTLVSLIYLIFINSKTHFISICCLTD